MGSSCIYPGELVDCFPSSIPHYGSAAWSDGVDSCRCKWSGIGCYSIGKSVRSVRLFHSSRNSSLKANPNVMTSRSLVVATAGTDEKVKFVEQHGAKGVNYKTQDFSKEVSFTLSFRE